MANTQRSLVPPGNKIEEFIQHPVAGASLLLAAAAVALVWANSAWAGSYAAWLDAPVTIGAGGFTLTKAAQLWINDGLMALFFFVVGLEIKREVLSGALSTWRQAALPLAAAIGGMVVPALIYVMINGGTPAARAWGVPMATDIAFALGVLALLGSRVPIQLKIFLTAVAIVDDIGAITVIAVFYTESLAIGALGAGFALLVAGAVANLAGVRSAAFYSLLGVVVWFAFLKSGVHATLAAVLLALVIPARARMSSDALESWMDRLFAEFRPGDRASEQAVLSDVATIANRGRSLAYRMEFALLPFVSMVVLPVFALANAGVAIDPSSFSPENAITLGVAAGLVLGNPIGIAGFAWLAVRAGMATLPRGVTWGQIVGVSALGGIGFTMSMFIAGLAFPTAAQQEMAKVGILAGSFVSAVIGIVVLLSQSARAPVSAAARPDEHDSPAMSMPHPTTQTGG